MRAGVRLAARRTVRACFVLVKGPERSLYSIRLSRNLLRLRKRSNFVRDRDSNRDSRFRVGTRRREKRIEAFFSSTTIVLRSNRSSMKARIYRISLTNVKRDDNDELEKISVGRVAFQGILLDGRTHIPNLRKIFSSMLGRSLANTRVRAHFAKTSSGTLNDPPDDGD